MKKMSRRIRLILITMLVSVIMIALMLAIYSGSIPQRYALNPGDASPFDITAPRSIRDKQETDLRAARAAAEVADVMLRSDQISAEVKDRVAFFFTLVDEVRLFPPLQTPDETEETTAETAPTEDPGDETGVTEPFPTEPEPEPINHSLYAEMLILRLDGEMNVIINQDDALNLVMLPDERVASIRGHVNSLTSLIMAESLDNAGLRRSIADRTEDLAETVSYYREDVSIIERILLLLLRPNVVFDQVATENARQAAYAHVQNNPVMIERGTRIVAAGDIITDDIYMLLDELALIDSGRFDYLHFSGIALLLLFIAGIAIFYVRNYEKENIQGPRDYAALTLSMLIPLIVSVYISRIAPLAPPVYFAAVLIAVYFRFRVAVIMSLVLTITVLPLTDFNPVFLVVAISGSLVAALFTRGIIRKDNYAFIIIATAGANFLMTLACGVLQKDDWTTITVNCTITALSGALSVITAIGIMPLFEMLFNTVSPLRLIELSQPSHPLLRRLFVEAPGSSQHSMMTANLADAAAVAIGASPLLARVGSYYHDIGKLENPLMFIENQEGENPHDSMMPDKSAQVILGHPEAGVRIARRYRLPPAIIRIIHEHHGSSSQAYFYHKARQMAEKGDMPEPDPDNYRYHCPIPSSRESALVMLADTAEAAMKATGTTNLDDAARLIRKLIKTKNEQEQLLQSGLAFSDIEKIVQAFLQVYAGHFHERVKYPDDRTVRKSTKKISD